jgi:hypothetical protein
MPSTILRQAQLGLRRRPAVRADSAYGTPDELKALIDAAHERAS